MHAITNDEERKFTKKETPTNKLQILNILYT